MTGRRPLLAGAMALLAAGGARAETGPAAMPMPAPLPPALSPATRAAWLAAWRASILAAARNRYCDTVMGEELGWLMSPVLEGFYQGYRATGETAWIARLIDWTDAWLGRAVMEPDGYPGWPEVGAAGTHVDDLDRFDADSLLGEAMALRPVVLAAAAIRRDPALAARHGGTAGRYLALARAVFTKWDRRGAWRAAGNGMISVVLPYGIDRAGDWTGDPGAGFSHPTNKANLVALWLLAMADATGDAAYRNRAAAWFRLMRARLHPAAGDTFQIWNYWQPAGPWDYRAPGQPKQWIGVHPKAGYYAIDVRAMTAAWRHKVVFTTADIARLIRTAQVSGRSWPALAPYDPTLRAAFERTLRPEGWEGLWLVPWYLAPRRA